MKELLGKARDPEIYKMITTLEARRTVPPLVSGDGTKHQSHEEMADCFGTQLNPIPKPEWEREDVDLNVKEADVGNALNVSPGNTASGMDGMSYPLLRFFWKKHRGVMMKMMEELMRSDTEDWHMSSCVLIKKGDKDRYDLAKSWRMVHLLPCMAKVAERVVLAKLEKSVTLGDSQFGSRKRRSTHDAMKVILDFMEYHKGRKCGMITMDVEGGFDKVNIDTLSDILSARGCPREVNLWIRRWAGRRSVRFRFNGRISKQYWSNQGVPQGSPLSPYLFGIYVSDIFRQRVSSRMAYAGLTISYVDDGTVLAATDSEDATKAELVKGYNMCSEVARNRGMGFSPAKVDWIGIGKGNWGDLVVDGNVKRMVKEVRVLGYRLDCDGKMGKHVEYWAERGIDVRRRIAAIGRRYGSERGIGSWECLRLIQGAYLPTIYYGLEFISSDVKLMKKVQVHVNDTIRSLIRAPFGLANSVMLAETGIAPAAVTGRYMERKGYKRQLTLGIMKDLPWYGCFGNRWKDDRISASREYSNKVLRTVPDITIQPSKEAAIKSYNDMCEKRYDDSEVWIFTDGSKRDDKAAVAWITMSSSGLVEDTKGLPIPATYSIVKAEIMAIGLAIADIRRKEGGKVVVFTDCQPALIKIRDMKCEGTSAGLYDCMSDILNEWDKVDMQWIPGHSGVLGNETVDGWAKENRKYNVALQGRWQKMNFDEGGGSWMREQRVKEWKEWQIKEGHPYYNRAPTKGRHQKGLTRLDAYVLIRLRSGTDKKGHENCQGFEFRHHLALCTRYDHLRPELETLYQDRKVGEWKKWWTYHEYLGMGIPSTLPEQMSVRVMFGNPFDNTITIEKNGATVVQRVERPNCDSCGKAHRGGKCLKEVADMKGRWFFVEGNLLECHICGGKYGGGSTSRPGGSGLKNHLTVNKNTCGRKWEIEYWESVARRWNSGELGGDYKIGMVIKWSELNCKGVLKC